MQTDAPGMRFTFSMQTAERNIEHFSNLTEATAFWQSLTTQRPMPNTAAWNLLDRDRDFLRQFLGRLRQTADYQHPEARTRLATRVGDLLQAMEQSTALRQLCSDCISDALQTCGDRVIWAMNQVETAVRVHQARQQSPDGKALKDLVLSLMRLDIVQTHARTKAASLQWVDEIEVFLAYESRLRQALALPVLAEHMLFATCAQVTPADLDKAQHAAEAAMQDTQRVAAYLQASDLWLHHLRQQTAAHWSWAALEAAPLPGNVKAQELLCPITQEPFAALAQPVMWRSGQACVVYEAEALLKHWVAHGTEPTTRQRMVLAGLRRPL